MAGHALIGLLLHLTADSVMAAVFLDVPYLPDLIRPIGKERLTALLPQKRLGLHRSYSKAKKTSPWLDRPRASMTHKRSSSVRKRWWHPE